ncbi:xanthine dehydrogenase accessory protein PucB [Paenibacillus marchantiophytorum]|uniref:Xanthine dehydrogenase accessory protein PucB n=1 Tax=Paenibacillus marchantiophytorum TaxID=1619310 RepID=A0ABQ1FJL6_9BACL|nr:nucleotidyltransferase family protein [Paenibacillus marchantiophytorum]GGA15698.1 xanthine dehydrogenase accessory protein PucB [Paenibacillus marchantiophytorum]
MSEAKKIIGIYLAAGSSKRMGTSKQSLELAAGTRLGSIALLHALQSEVHSVVVVVREDDPLDWLSAEVLAYAETGRCLVEVCAEAGRGMAHSLRVGIVAAERQNADGILVVLADQPFIDAQMLNRLMAAFSGEAGRDFVASGDQGMPKPPVILGREMWPSALALEGDAGARSLFHLPQYRGQVLDEDEALKFLDIDTEERYLAAKKILWNKLMLS